MIDHIVFDIGKVLIRYEPELAFIELIPDRHHREWFFENVCTGAWNIEQDRGRSWSEGETLLIDQFPDEEAYIRAFRKNWRKMVPSPIDGSVEILRKLIADDCDVTMLTNFASDTFREAQNMYPFLLEPRGVTVSGDVGLVKPDIAIYEIHHGAFGLNPARTLFVDDVPANVDAARKAGWHAVRFIDAEILRRDLAGFGVMV
jgi:2-haloacid dehalogenase